MAHGIFMNSSTQATAEYSVTGWVGAMSTAVALLVSPVTIAFCRRKSTRLTAVMGGLVTALGCLFTSFASQFHQLFFSYGTIVGGYHYWFFNIYLEYFVFDTVYVQ